MADRPGVPWPRELAELPYAAALTEHSGALEDGGDYDTVHFARTGFDHADASAARFLECAFTGVSLNGGRFRRSRFLGCWLREVRITAADLAETQWNDTTVVGGVLAAAQAFTARLDRVVFAGCKLDSVNFREAKLTDVTFTDCLLREVDFAGATLRRTACTGCTLTGTDFTRTAMDQVDLRGSELGLIAGASPLRGAIISSGQLAAIAPVLAEAIGIVVDDG